MKKIIGIITAVFGISTQALAEEKTFPPVPKWKPEFHATIESQLGRMIYYTDNGKDLAVFKFGTIAVLPDDLSDSEAEQMAKEILSKIYNYHPDMNPINMDDGNILVQYNHPAYNVVISDFIAKYMSKIREEHLDGLATDEVIITSAGPNKFDEFGMKALYGRAFMFMDAQTPEIVQIYRKASNKSMQPTANASAD